MTSAKTITLIVSSLVFPQHIFCFPRGWRLQLPTNKADLAGNGPILGSGSAAAMPRLLRLRMHGGELLCQIPSERPLPVLHTGSVCDCGASRCGLVCTRLQAEQNVSVSSMNHNC